MYVRGHIKVCVCVVCVCVCVCVCVRACALYLQEVGWKHVMSVSIIEGQGCGETGHGDPLLDTGAYSATPGLLQHITPVTHTHTHTQTHRKNT